MTQQKQQESVSVSDTVITDGAVTQYEPIPVPASTDLKVQRLVQIKQSIEAKLQVAIAEATRVRKMISTSKTDCKRKFYDKKFAKINTGVREDVLALQQIQYLISKNTGEVDAADASSTPIEN